MVIVQHGIVQHISGLGPFECLAEDVLLWLHERYPEVPKLSLPTAEDGGSGATAAPQQVEQLQDAQAKKDD